MANPSRCSYLNGVIIHACRLHSQGGLSERGTKTRCKNPPGASPDQEPEGVSGKNDHPLSP